MGLNELSEGASKVRSIIVFVLLVAGLLGSWSMWVDTRYAHSSEMKELAETVKSIQQLQIKMLEDQKKTSLQSQMWKLEDRYECVHFACRSKMELSIWEVYRKICEELNHMEDN